MATYTTVSTGTSHSSAQPERVTSKVLHSNVLHLQYSSSSDSSSSNSSSSSSSNNSSSNSSDSSSNSSCSDSSNSSSSSRDTTNVCRYKTDKPKFRKIEHTSSHNSDFSREKLRQRSNVQSGKSTLRMHKKTSNEGKEMLPETHVRSSKVSGDRVECGDVLCGAEAGGMRKMRQIVDEDITAAELGTQKTERRSHEIPVHSAQCCHTHKYTMEDEKYRERNGKQKLFGTSNELVKGQYSALQNECNTAGLDCYGYSSNIDDDILLLNLCEDQEQDFDSTHNRSDVWLGFDCDNTPSSFVRRSQSNKLSSLSCDSAGLERNNQTSSHKTRSLSGREKDECDVNIISQSDTPTNTKKEIVKNILVGDKYLADKTITENSTSSDCLLKSYNTNCCTEVISTTKSESVATKHQRHMLSAANSKQTQMTYCFHSDMESKEKKSLTSCFYGNTSSRREGKDGKSLTDCCIGNTCSQRKTEEAKSKTDCLHGNMFSDRGNEQRKTKTDCLHGNIASVRKCKERKSRKNHLHGNMLSMKEDKKGKSKEDCIQSNMFSYEVSEEGITKTDFMNDNAFSSGQNKERKSVIDCVDHNRTSCGDSKIKERKSKANCYHDNTLFDRESRECKSRKNCLKDNNMLSSRESKRRKTRTDCMEEKNLKLSSDLRTATHNTFKSVCGNDTASNCARTSHEEDDKDKTQGNTCNDRLIRQHENRGEREMKSQESHRTKEHKRSSECERHRKKDERNKINVIADTSCQGYRERNQLNHSYKHSCRMNSNDWHQGAAHESGYRHHGRYEYHSQRGVGYCFVNFASSTAAKNALIRLNGKVLPYSSPPKRFKLNMANFRGPNRYEKEYSVFVGPLSPDIDDYQLYSVFSKKYKSVRSVRVVRTPEGVSRGFGFVRFTSEYELQRSLTEMQDSMELGYHPIKIRMSVPKDRSNESSNTTSSSSSSYNNNYNKPATTNYNYQSNVDYNMWWQQQNAQYYQQYPYSTPTTNTMNQSQVVPEEYDEELQDPELEVDVDKLNSEFMRQSEELYTALEECRWHTLSTDGAS